MINLCGQDFPTRRNVELVEFLKALNGSNWIESKSLWQETKEAVQKQTWAEPLLESDISPYSKQYVAFGSAYNFFSYSFLQWARKTHLPRFFTELEGLKKSYSPDEILWATLNRFPDAPGGVSNQLVNDPKLSRTVMWKRTGQKCHGPRFRNWICIFGIGDLEFILNDEKIDAAVGKYRPFFANKFDDDGDDLVLQCLEYLLHES